MLDIMIVEDEQLTLMKLESSLEELGHRTVATFDTGEQAVSEVGEVEPDVILMDIRLSGSLDGIEAAKQILETHSVPVIYVTAHSDEETLRKAQVTRPRGYLVKPFSDVELEEALTTAVNG